MPDSKCVTCAQDSEYCKACDNDQFYKPAEANESGRFDRRTLPDGSVAKPVAEFTKAEFMQACWEMYREWQQYEGGAKLPGYENCLHYIEVNGLPD